MLRKALLLIAGLTGLALMTLPASAAFIQCPGATMKREITTPLPNNWWQTPIVAGLQSTAIQTIGGKPTLVCKYGAAGQIMRLKPPLQTCNPVSGGFQCSGIIQPQPQPNPIKSQGTINLPQTYTANLDNGQVTQAGADLWYEAVNPIVKFLVPRNGATMWVGGASAQGENGCAAGPFAGSKIPLLLVPAGTHICVKTDQGRISEIRVNGYGGTTLTMSYTTWN